MLLYLMRHGLANWPNWARADNERPLNPEGTRQIQALGAALAQRGVQPARILHSPLARAFETATVLAEALGVSDRVQEQWHLRPGFSLADLRLILHQQATLPSLLLVGHNPDMPEQLHQLTGGWATFREGTVACIQLDQPEAERGGVLRWVAPPAFIIGESA